MRVQNDILRAVDQRSDVVLVLLDLWAAFDTVDHQILLRRLRDRYGVHGEALAWCTSYLSDRQQSVVIGDSVSATHFMSCSVYLKDLSLVHSCLLFMLLHLKTWLGHMVLKL